MKPLSRLASCLIVAALAAPIFTLGAVTFAQEPERPVLPLLAAPDLATASILNRSIDAIVSLLALAVIVMTVLYAIERWRAWRSASRREDAPGFYDAWRLPDPGGG